MTQPARKQAKKVAAKRVAAPAKTVAPAKKRGPPPFAPTPEQRQLVMLGVAMGLTQAQIARQVNFPDGISEPTLRKHFQEELENGLARLTMMVGKNLASIAADKSHPRSVTAAIFFLKARAGWRDGGEVNVNVQNTNTVQASAQVDQVLTPEEFREIAQNVAKEV